MVPRAQSRIFIPTDILWENVGRLRFACGGSLARWYPCIKDSLKPRVSRKMKGIIFYFIFNTLNPIISLVLPTFVSILQTQERGGREEVASMSTNMETEGFSLPFPILCPILLFSLEYMVNLCFGANLFENNFRTLI